MKGREEEPAPHGASIEGEAHPRAGVLALFAAAGFASLTAMRLCDAMLPALADAFATRTTDAAAVISSFAVAYGVMQLVYGPLGDRYGKQRVIAFATACCGVATLAAGFAPSLEALVAARAAMGAAAAAVVPLSFAWIGDQFPLERSREVLARFIGATLSGILIGTLAGGVITELLGWRAAFLLLAPVFAFVAVALFRRPRHAEPQPPPQPYWRRVAELLAAPWPRFVFAAVLVEGLFVFGPLAFVPTLMHEQFGLSLGASGMILALFALGGLAFSRASRLLLGRFTPPALAGVGATLLTISFLLLAIMPHWAWAVAGCALAGLGFYTFHNNLQFSATQLSTTARGVAVSLFAGCMFVGQSIGVAVAARAFSQYSHAVGFGASALVLALLGFLLARKLGARQAPMPGKQDN